MADCIRSLLINCSHLKELFIINHILKYFFQLSPMHFSGEPDFQGQRLKYLSVKRGKGYALYRPLLSRITFTTFY